MCTVTFIPVNDSIFFTSNRDEKNKRTPAIPPAVYPLQSGRMIFPKDGAAGGTWIAGHDNGNVVVFLNGGFVAHTPAPSYRKSRGLILLDIIDNPTPFNGFVAMNLNNIEPFTAVIYDNQQLFECRWDGTRKHTLELDSNVPHIWSSVTLYNQDVINKRNIWFSKWITAHANPGQDEILHFHQFTGDGDERNDLLMNRDGQMSTVSITSAKLSPAGIEMVYMEMAGNTRYSEQLLMESSIAGR